MTTFNHKIFFYEFPWTGSNFVTLTAFVVLILYIGNVDIIFVIYSLNTDGTIKTVEVHSFQKRYTPERHYVSIIVLYFCCFVRSSKVERTFHITKVK